MDRRVNARFMVVRINRLVISLALIAALALLLLPGRRLLPVGSLIGPRTVRQGVTLNGREFSGTTEAEAKAMLRQMAGSMSAQPVDATERMVDGVSYVVPEMYGYSLDVDLTWLALATAREGTPVEPALKTAPSARRLADFPQGVIERGNPAKQAVTLLINVDWGTKELGDMLPVLKKRGVKASFFVSGRWAKGNKALLEVIAKEGHEIATHGNDLKYGPRDLMKQGKLKDDIAQSVAVIESIPGVGKVQYYAPHMSEVSPEIVKTAADLNLRTVLYSLDTVDWQDPAPAVILQRIGKAKAGDLILMHPKPNTAKVLEQAILNLEAKGLHPVTLSEMLSPEPDAASQAWRGQHE